MSIDGVLPVWGYKLILYCNVLQLQCEATFLALFQWFKANFNIVLSSPPGIKIFAETDVGKILSGPVVRLALARCRWSNVGAYSEKNCVSVQIYRAQVILMRLCAFSLLSLTNLVN